MNAEELKAITQRLADVDPPPAPDWQTMIVTAIVIAIALLLAIGLIYLRSRRKQPHKVTDTTREALHQLQLVRQAWEKREIDDHETAYRLATLLRLGLELNQLTAAPPPALADEQQQWQAVQQLLTRLRYRPQTTIEGAESPSPITAQEDAALGNDLFVQIEQWLKHGATPC